MAKSGNRGGGEGTNDRGGVRSTFSPAFPKGSNTGEQQDMGGGYAGRSGGANGLPTRTFDSIGGRAQTPAPGSPFQAPSSQGQKRPGTK
jgi:hypothetical protein